MVIYYQKFILNCSSVAKLLFNLTAAPKGKKASLRDDKHFKKLNPSDWTQEHSESFQKLKSSLLESVVLAHHDFSRPFILSTDVSLDGFKVQGFFICHIIVIQGITRSEMQSNQVRSVTVQNNKNTNYISNITQGHTYGKNRRNKNKMCNEIKKCKTIRCAKNNKMCKRQ